MKIVYICNEYPPKISGGIGVFTKLMAERLAAEGHEIIVFGYGENALETVELGYPFDWGKSNDATNCGK